MSDIEVTNIEQAARAYVNKRHPAWHDNGVGIVQGSHYRSGFVAGASWLAEYLLSDDNVERAAKVLDVHRWKTMGVSTVECECGEIIGVPTFDTGDAIEDSVLQAFPADRAFRLHLARAALRAVLSEGEPS